MNRQNFTSDETSDIKLTYSVISEILPFLNEATPFCNQKAINVQLLFVIY